MEPNWRLDFFSNRRIYTRWIWRNEKHTKKKKETSWVWFDHHSNADYFLLPCARFSSCRLLFVLLRVFSANLETRSRPKKQISQDCSCKLTSPSLGRSKGTFLAFESSYWSFLPVYKSNALSQWLSCRFKTQQALLLCSFSSFSAKLASSLCSTFACFHPVARSMALIVKCMCWAKSREERWRLRRPSLKIGNKQIPHKQKPQNVKFYICITISFVQMCVLIHSVMCSPRCWQLVTFLLLILHWCMFLTDSDF